MRNSILVRGARENNLKNVDVEKECKIGRAHV